MISVTESLLRKIIRHELQISLKESIFYGPETPDQAKKALLKRIHDAWVYAKNISLNTSNNIDNLRDLQENLSAIDGIDFNPAKNVFILTLQSLTNVIESKRKSNIILIERDTRNIAFTNYDELANKIKVDKLTKNAEIAKKQFINKLEKIYREIASVSTKECKTAQDFLYKTIEHFESLNESEIGIGITKGIRSKKESLLIAIAWTGFNKEFIDARDKPDKDEEDKWSDDNNPYFQTDGKGGETLFKTLTKKKFQKLGLAENKKLRY